MDQLLLLSLLVLPLLLTSLLLFRKIYAKHSQQSSTLLSNS